MRRAHVTAGDPLTSGTAATRRSASATTCDAGTTPSATPCSGTARTSLPDRPGPCAPCRRRPRGRGRVECRLERPGARRRDGRGRASRPARDQRGAPSFAYEDLLQEALIFLSTKRDLREGLDEGGLGVLHHRLWSDLTDYARKENRRLHLNLSYDELVEAVDEELRPPGSRGHRLRHLGRGTPPTACRTSECPTPGCPRPRPTLLTATPSTPCSRTSARRGGSRTSRRSSDRPSCCTTASAGSPKEIAYNQGVTQRAAAYRIERAIGRLTAWLNRDIYHDGYDAPADEGVTV